QQMIGCFAPDCRVRIGDAAEFVLLFLEEVRVDRADAHSQGFRKLPECDDVLDAIPGNVNGNRWADSGVPLDFSRILEFLEWITWHARLREDLEPGARVPVSPGGRLDSLGS